MTRWLFAVWLLAIAVAAHMLFAVEQEVHAREAAQVESPVGDQGLGTDRLGQRVLQLGRDLQRRGPVNGSVLGVAVANGLDRRLLDVFRRVEIRLTGTETDDVFAIFF